MTIYQAIKQYASIQSHPATGGADSATSKIVEDHLTDIDAESGFLGNAVWNKLHTIHYRLAAAPSPTTKTTPAASGEASKTNSDNNNNTTSKPATRQSQKLHSKRATNGPIPTSSAAADDDEDNDKEDTGRDNEAVSNLNADLSKTHFLTHLNSVEWRQHTMGNTPAAVDSIKTDKSIESLNLLYLLNLLNRYWFLLYRDFHNYTSPLFLSKTFSSDYLIS